MSWCSLYIVHSTSYIWSWCKLYIVRSTSYVCVCVCGVCVYVHVRVCLITNDKCNFQLIINRCINIDEELQSRTNLHKTVGLLIVDIH